MWHCKYVCQELYIRGVRYQDNFLWGVRVAAKRAVLEVANSKLRINNIVPDRAVLSSIQQC